MRPRAIGVLSSFVIHRAPLRARTSRARGALERGLAPAPSIVIGFGLALLVGTTLLWLPPEGGWRHADSNTVLHAGDTVIALGPTRSVEAFAQLR